MMKKIICLVVIITVQNTLTMYDDDARVAELADKRYDEQGLLEEKSTLSQLSELTQRNKLKATMSTVSGGGVGYGLSQVSLTYLHDKEGHASKFITEHATEVTIGSTLVGSVVGLAAFFTYFNGKNTAKRTILEIIKENEKKIEDTVSSEALDDITKNIRLEFYEEQLNSTIEKYNQMKFY